MRKKSDGAGVWPRGFRLIQLWGTLAFVVGILPGLASAQETGSNVDKRGRTIISEEPYSPPEPGIEPKVIYGDDDRIDVYQETDPMILDLAAATCGLTDASRLSDNGNGTYTIQTSAYRNSGLPPCSGEPFANQPTAMWCSGFLVGPDIIATAGHCYDSSDLSGTRFVFGFQMQDAITATTVVDESQVYQGVEILGYALGGGLDYSVIRVDRVVVAPGAVPLDIRRTGTVPNNTQVGMIGHPSGLPLKIAFGAQTRVYDNSPSGFFEANLDAYGGNSGSPVFSQATGIVEGILVRGSQDFVISGSCFLSNRLDDSQASEDVSKTTTFAQYIPELDGTITLGKSVYKCGDAIELTVRDYAASGPSITVGLMTGAGDTEAVDLYGPIGASAFTGSITLSAANAPVNPGDGILQTGEDDNVTVEYSFGGSPQTETAMVDCVPPIITGVMSEGELPTSARVTFTTNEDTTSRISLGTSCQYLPTIKSGPLATSHSIQFQDLAEATLYFYQVTAKDLAGNETVQTGPYNNCFWLQTAAYGVDVVSADFDDGTLQGWTSEADEGGDDWQVISSPFARSSPNVAAFEPSTSTLRDARLVSPPFTDGDALEFYHTYSTEKDFDGCIVEISTDGGTIWQDLGNFILENGYNGVIATGYGSPIGGQDAWNGGEYGTMNRTTIDLTPFLGEKRVAFRFTADHLVPSNGWQVDDVRVYTAIKQTPPTSANAWFYY